MNEIVINYVQENAILPPIIFNTACSYYEQEITLRPYGNAFHQIMFILDGEGFVKYKNKKYPLKEGCAFYIGSNIPIEYRGTNNMVVAFLTLKGEAVAQLARNYQCDGFLYYNDIDTRKYILDINSIIEENSSYKRQGIMSLLSYSVYVNFFEHSQKIFNSIDKIAIYLDENFTKNITLNEIAAEFNISVSKLCHDFKNRFKCTVFEYILNSRLVYARHIILANPDSKTKDVAVDCGFEDVSYFCKAYKKKYNITPSEDKKTLNKAIK